MDATNPSRDGPRRGCRSFIEGSFVPPPGCQAWTGQTLFFGLDLVPAGPGETRRANAPQRSHRMDSASKRDAGPAFWPEPRNDALPNDVQQRAKASQCQRAG